jgi:hypothetical protein
MFTSLKLLAKNHLIFNLKYSWIHTPTPGKDLSKDMEQVVHKKNLCVDAMSAQRFKSSFII